MEAYEQKSQSERRAEKILEDVMRERLDKIRLHSFKLTCDKIRQGFVIHMYGGQKLHNLCRLTYKIE